MPKNRTLAAKVPTLVRSHDARFLVSDFACSFVVATKSLPSRMKGLSPLGAALTHRASMFDAALSNWMISGDSTFANRTRSLTEGSVTDGWAKTQA